jgi:hypothetical protein
VEEVGASLGAEYGRTFAVAPGETGAVVQDRADAGSPASTSRASATDPASDAETNREGAPLDDPGPSAPAHEGLTSGEPAVHDPVGCGIGVTTVGRQDPDTPAQEHRVEAQLGQHRRDPDPLRQHGFRIGRAERCEPRPRPRYVAQRAQPDHQVTRLDPGGSAPRGLARGELPCRAHPTRAAHAPPPTARV